MDRVQGEHLLAQIYPCVYMCSYRPSTLEEFRRTVRKNLSAGFKCPAGPILPELPDMFTSINARL